VIHFRDERGELEGNRFANIRREVPSVNDCGSIEAGDGVIIALGGLDQRAIGIEGQMGLVGILIFKLADTNIEELGVRGDVQDDTCGAAAGEVNAFTDSGIKGSLAEPLIVEFASTPRSLRGERST